MRMCAENRNWVIKRSLHAYFCFFRTQVYMFSGSNLKAHVFLQYSKAQVIVDGRHRARLVMSNTDLDENKNLKIILGQFRFALCVTPDY